MGDHRSRPPLRIRPRPSRQLGGFVTIAHLAAAAVVPGLPIAWPWKLMALLLILLALVWLLWAQVLGRAPWSIREAVWDQQGWRLLLVDGRVRDARLAPSSYVGVSLVILNLRIGRLGRRSLVLTPDRIDADLLRRLRVRLRLEGTLDPSQAALH